MKKKEKIVKAHENSTNKAGLLFMAILILLLPVVLIKGIGDRVMMPRLLMLSITMILLVFYSLSKNRVANFNAFNFYNPIVAFGCLYFISIIISYVSAFDFREGFGDAIKAFNVILMLVFLPVLFKDTNQWFKKISIFVIIASVIAVCIGYYQYFTLVFNDPVKFLPDGRETLYRITGLMAHKNQFSISLMLQLPFLVYAIFRIKGFWRIAASISAIAVLILLLILQTRSVWVGVGFMFLFSVLLILINYRKFGLSKIFMIVAISSIVVTAGLLSLAMVAKNTNDNIYLWKLQNLTDLNAYNNTFRVRILGATVDLIKDNPVLGVGAGNWKFEISNYFGNLHFEQKDFNWLRPHNDYLWIWSEKGILGLLFYLGIFVSVFYYGIKVIRKDFNQDEKIISLLLLAGISAYMIVSLFTFPLERINQQLYLGIFLSGIIALNLKNKQNEKKLNLNKRYLTYSLGAILFLSIFYCVAIIKQEYHVIKAIAHSNKGNWNEVLDETDKATSVLKVMDPRALPIEYYNGLAYASLGDHQKSIQHYTTALKSSPNNITVLNNLGQEYYKIGDYQKAINYFDHATSIIPTFMESLVNVSTTYYQLGEYQKALDALTKIRHSERSEVMYGNIRALRKIIREENQRKRKERMLKKKQQKEAKAQKNQ